LQNTHVELVDRLEKLWVAANTVIRQDYAMATLVASNATDLAH